MLTVSQAVSIQLHHWLDSLHPVSLLPIIIKVMESIINTKVIKHQFLTNNLLAGDQLEFQYLAEDNLETTSWLKLIHKAHGWSVMEYSPLTWMSNSSTQKELNAQLVNVAHLMTPHQRYQTFIFFHHCYTMAVLSWLMMVHKVRAWTLTEKRITVPSQSLG